MRREGQSFRLCSLPTTPPSHQLLTTTTRKRSQMRSKIRLLSWVVVVKTASQETRDCFSSLVGNLTEFVTTNLSLFACAPRYVCTPDLTDSYATSAGQEKYRIDLSRRDMLTTSYSKYSSCILIKIGTSYLIVHMQYY